MNRFYHNLPKIELHAHLSGSISLAFWKRESITNRNIQNIISGFDFETWNGDIDRCFDAFRTIHKLIETPEILERATISVIEEFHQENVILLELRTTLRPVPTHRSYLNAVIKGIQSAPSI
uniref:Adenosine deaminase-related n=1 Tax=Schistosoma mansoni TaxID=6183 RepID=A0A5K4ENT1_SCHMA